MTLRERLGALDRFQRTRGFKIGASIAVLVLAVAVLGVYFVNTSSPGDAISIDLPEGMSPQLAERERREMDLLKRALSGGSTGGSAVVVGTLSVTAVALVAVWFGLGLTYLGLLAVGAAVCVPLYLLGTGTANAARLIAGVIVLTMAFTVLLRALRVVFSLPGATFAIARNVLAEAVRLKLSLVFIVMLVFALAALPLLLDAEAPLRHRVQAFLQYATGGSFWIIAILVLFFSVATVSFEQRDKVIWQTVTKPVAAWQYLLGKWMGVAGLAALLMTVTSAGVFIFTAFLANQPAIGESSPFVPRDQSLAITEDRLVLTTQVLAARKTSMPRTAMQVFEIDMDAALAQRVQAERAQDARFEPSNTDFNRYRIEIYEQMSLAYQSIDPREETYEEYVFDGLERARDSSTPIVLRYKINAEGNRPDQIYTLSFQFPDGSIAVRRTGLGFSHTMTLSPDAIQDGGTLYLRVYNGELRSGGPQNSAQFLPNAETITFPSDGLSVSYAVGSYHMNFVRIMFVLWVKLAFLAAVGIWAATFLSFPVAALLAIGTFFTAEAASWVSYSLESFGPKNVQNEWQLWRVIIGGIARAVSTFFLPYAELKPTARLSTGLLLSWAGAFRGTLVLILATLGLYAFGVIIFRRRELATYSGQ
ncbi:MAG: hypothetical protein DHS20C14_00720 [Phycisphaeraceae bacterium]|nr:MAG: hypothetical protein DHS20C14_00720 [Phycisphaeraceae bacterium]